MPSRPFTRRWLRIHACAREIELDKIVAIVKQLSSETVPEGDKVMTAETLQASQLERLAGRGWPGAPALLHRGGVVQGGYPAGAVGPDQPAHPGVRRGGPPARPAGRDPARGRRGPGDQVTAVMPPHVGLAVTLPVPARAAETS